jgi:hypothetical protein
MRLLCLTAILAAVTACASATSGNSGADRGDALSREQIGATRAPNAYDAVARLRPRWLMARSASTLQADGNPVLVYVDGHRMGQVQELRSLPIENISEIRYVDARDATTRYGTGHANGVIEVTTLRRR